MVWLLAIATGLIVANLYYAQTPVGPISRATGLTPGAAGLIVTLTQIGYCLGLLFIVPLGDLMENRRLIFIALLTAAVALLAAASTSSAALFLLAALCIGLCSVAAQVLVPFAAHLSLPHTRGQTVGTVMSGLLMGIMLARPVASLMADALGWHGRAGLRAAPQATAAPAGVDAELSGAAGVDVAFAESHAHPAPPRRLSSLHVRRLQPVLDHRVAGVDQHRLRRQPERRGHFRAGRRGRRDRLADRRPPGRSRHEPLHHGAGDAIGRARLRHAAGGARRPHTRTGRAGAGLHRARHGCLGQSGDGAARHLRAGAGSAQPLERPVHGDLFCRRRGRLVARRVDVRGARLARRAADRPVLPAARAAAVRDRTTRRLAYSR